MKRGLDGSSSMIWRRRSIDVQVLRLRQIIEEDPSKPRFIKTVWGVGYMLVAGVAS